MKSLTSTMILLFISIRVFSQDPALDYACYLDSDGDGYGDPTQFIIQNSEVATECPINYVKYSLDCNDEDKNIHPMMSEICNDVDDNCDNQKEEGLTFLDYYPDNDNDGVGDRNAQLESSCKEIDGKVANNKDCDDTNSAINTTAAEKCNDIDDDCDGDFDEDLPLNSFYPDQDNDGVGDSGSSPKLSCRESIPGNVTNNKDCDDSNPEINTTAAEKCNDIDDDCDGIIDEDLLTVNYYPDSDNDGEGDATASALASCKQPIGKVANNKDCNDSNAAIKSTATESCNNIDDNCNGNIDEGCVYSWVTGAYGSCSVTCGNGIQVRAVTCKDQFSIIHSDTKCIGQTKPSTQQACTAPYFAQTNSQCFPDEASYLNYLNTLISNNNTTPVTISFSGNYTTPNNLSIPSNVTLAFDSGYQMTIPSGSTVTINGKIKCPSGIINNGTIKGGGTFEGPVTNNGIVSPG